MTYSKNEITGIILSGGKSSRMGQNKSLLIYNNQTFIEHLCNTFSSLCNNIIISANSNDYSFLKHTVVKDIFPEKGPLSGLHSALSASQTQINIVAACDTPLLPKELFLKLLKNTAKQQIVIANVIGRTQPLIGVFKKELVSIYEEKLKKGEFSPFYIMKELHYEEVYITKNDNFYSEKAFLNINNQTDYQKLLAL